MKIRYIPLFVLSVLLLSFSCENKEDISLSESERHIIGEWNWIESVYYYTISGIPYIMNPDTLGFAITCRFEADGTYKVYRDAFLDNMGIYWFETIKYENGTVSPLRLFTQEDEYTKSVNFSFSGDTLILDETEVDGAKRVFVRNH
ncbi:MAG: hypothetical protein JXR41_00435 [Bacteroidales bacterium]|nr:hypothetical protein [Bacteroidales bacterium]MBN2761526.1 hypothetical protein [Bacteroidales bacterium]